MTYQPSIFEYSEGPLHVFPMTLDDWLEYIEVIEEAESQIIKPEMFAPIYGPFQKENWDELNNRRKGNIRKAVEPLGESWCQYHGRFEPIENFYKKPDAANGLCPFCKEAASLLDSQYRADNPDYVIYKHAYTNSVKTAKKYGAKSTVTLEDFRRLFYATNGFTCQLTGTAGTIEHLKSFESGGTNEMSNITVVSGSLNTSRRSRSYFDILNDVEYCERFGINRDKLARLLQRKAFENNMCLEVYRKYLEE